MNRQTGSRALTLLALSMLAVSPAWCEEAAPAPAAQQPDAADPDWSLRDALDRLPFRLNGFLDSRAGIRTQNDPHQSRDGSVGEARLQLEAGKALNVTELKLKTDFLYDAVLDEAEVDLREADALLTPFDFADLKIGRQALTWGTGDLIFINDLFPKDWQSFFIGRDDEYLKAPSDALKASIFTDVANLDLVYAPRFNPDRYIDGERLSYWSDQLGRRAGEDDRVRDDEPDDWFRDHEIAARIFKNLNGYEVAGYYYYGYWKSPGGMDPTTGKAAFPNLSVYGASVRGSVGKGIGNLEVGYYDSRDDSAGRDPLVKNSEFRALIGYEQEVAKNFTAALQYYLELIMDYGDYKRTLSSGVRARDEDRHVVTLRLTRLLMSQNLKLSIFAYYSPSDQDAHLRPKLHYKVSDYWSVEIGANVFLSADSHTFLGQFEKNTNLYVGARWMF